MTCKDCIHYDVCEWDKDKYDKSIITSFPNCNEKDCGLFKNKADFVEVVRCKDCIYKITDDERCFCRINAENAFGTWFNLKATLDDYFCSYGVRK